MTHRPLISVTVSLCLGILLNQYIHFPFYGLALLAFLSALLSFMFFHRGTASQCFLLLFFVLLGCLYSQNKQSIPQDHIARIAKYYRSGMVSMEGVVASEVVTRDFHKGKKLSFVVDIRRFKTDYEWRAKTGKVLVNLFRDEKVQYGDYVSVDGKLYRPFDFSSKGKFSYRDYLNRRGITLMLSIGKKGRLEVLRHGAGNFLKAASLKVKNILKQVLADHLSSNEAALMQAFLLGERTYIAPHINDLFIQTGTAHILAISGFNVGIVAFLIYLIFKTLPLGRKPRYILTMACVVFYAFLTGGQPSVVRATIMAVVFIASFLVERETDVMNSLSLAALIILTVNPLNLFDVGFQLSFVSVIAIIVIYPKILRLLSKLPLNLDSRSTLFLVQSLAVSLAAWLGVAGLIAYYFDTITPVTVLANLPVVPLSTLIVALGLGLLLTGVVVPGCAFIFAACLKIAINLMVGCIFIFAQIPGAYFYIANVSVWQTAIYYLILFLIFFWPIKRRLKLTK